VQCKLYSLVPQTLPQASGVVTTNRPVEPSATGIKGFDRRKYALITDFTFKQPWFLDNWYTFPKFSLCLRASLIKRFVGRIDCLIQLLIAWFDFDPGRRWFYRTIGSDYPLSVVIDFRLQAHIGKGLVNSPMLSCSANPQSLGSVNIQLSIVNDYTRGDDYSPVLRWSHEPRWWSGLHAGFLHVSLLVNVIMSSAANKKCHAVCAVHYLKKLLGRIMKMQYGHRLLCFKLSFNSLSSNAHFASIPTLYSTITWP